MSKIFSLLMTSFFVLFLTHCDSNHERSQTSEQQPVKDSGEHDVQNTSTADSERSDPAMAHALLAEGFLHSLAVMTEEDENTLLIELKSLEENTDLESSSEDPQELVIKLEELDIPRDLVNQILGILFSTLDKDSEQGVISDEELEKIDSLKIIYSDEETLAKAKLRLRSILAKLAKEKAINFENMKRMVMRLIAKHGKTPEEHQEFRDRIKERVKDIRAKVEAKKAERQSEAGTEKVEAGGEIVDKKSPEESLPMLKYAHKMRIHYLAKSLASKYHYCLIKMKKAAEDNLEETCEKIVLAGEGSAVRETFDKIIASEDKEAH